MKIHELEVTIKFTEPVLGMSSGNVDIHREFIAEKAKDAEKTEEEVKAIPVGEMIEKTSTVFPKDETGLFVWDYQMRGFFKEQIRALIELAEPVVKKLSKWQYKKAVDQFLLIRPRRIYLFNVDGNIHQTCEMMKQRTLRGDTMQGERIALASSQMLPAGTSLTCTVQVITGSNPKSSWALLSPELVASALAYGSLHGFGQWRSGGWGKFDWDVKELGVKEM